MKQKSQTNFIYKAIPTLEKFFLLLLAIGLALNFLQLGLPQITSISLAALGIIFFLSGNGPGKVPVPEDGSLYGFRELLSYTILPKILWISTSILTTGILFYTMQLQGYLSMIAIGSTMILIGSILLLGSMAMGTKYLNHVIPVLYRSTPTLIAGIYIYLKVNPGILG